jgi:hypothetical protein
MPAATASRNLFSLYVRIRALTLRSVTIPSHGGAVSRRGLTIEGTGITLTRGSVYLTELDRADVYPLPEVQDCVAPRAGR